MAVTDAERVQIRPLGVGEETAVRTAYAERFEGDVDARAPAPPSEASWRWRGELGAARTVAAFEGEAVVGLIAGLAQPAVHGGESVTLTRVDDLRIDAARRRGLDSPGLVIRMGQAWGEAFGGGDDVMSWGFPTPAAWRVANWHLKVQAVRTQLALFAAPNAVRLPRAGGVDVEPVERFGDEVEPLCEQLAAERGLWVRRSTDWLNWRLRDRPGSPCEIAVARRRGVTTGVAAFRRGSFDGRENLGLVADFQVPAADAESAAALLAWLVDRAHATGCDELVHLLPETAPDWRFFQDRAGFVARRLRTRFLLAHRAYLKRLRMHWLHGNWHYTLGDTDFA